MVSKNLPTLLQQENIHTHMLIWFCLPQKKYRQAPWSAAICIFSTWNMDGRRLFRPTAFDARQVKWIGDIVLISPMTFSVHTALRQTSRWPLSYLWDSSSMPSAASLRTNYLSAHTWSRSAPRLSDAVAARCALEEVAGNSGRTQCRLKNMLPTAKSITSRYSYIHSISATFPVFLPSIIDS